MKKNFFYIFLLISAGLFWTACEKEGNYPGGTVNPYLPILDLRSVYKGKDLTLSPDNMFGSTKITGVVVSDHSGRNLPAGLLILQDKRRLNQLRGISVDLGPEAASYVTGDSVIVDVQGGRLTRENGYLEIKNVGPEDVTKVSSGNAIPINRVGSSFIQADPDKYESTLVAIVKGTLDPQPAPGDVLSGDKVVNDGFGDIILHTEPTANFASKDHLPVNANYFGVVLPVKGSDGKLVVQHRIRKAGDMVVLSSEVQRTPVIISGFLADPEGSDGNNEYVQLLATTDIDFSVTPFSVVVCNNAGASNPTGFPSLGWATGSLAKSGAARTYKFNLTAGRVSKGSFFYVGGSNKLINGSGSTSIASANWIRSFDYSNVNGDGFGLKTSNLMANSGNAWGIAVFEGTSLTVDSMPEDVIFVHSGGSLYTAAPVEMGYRIGNTDFYDAIDPISLKPQPYFRSGTNTLCLTYTTPSDQGFFYKLGGVYNTRLNKWVLARTQSIVDLDKKSEISAIEGEGATSLK